jgi:transcriptional regulator with XRE-family HTH domain
VSQKPRQRVRATPRRLNRTPLPGSRFLSEVIGANIRRLRRASGANQKTMATQMTELGHATFSRATMGEVERANRTLSVDELLAVAMILGVDLAELLRTDGPIDFGGGVSIPSTVMSDWIRGRVTVHTTGPSGYMVTAKPELEDLAEATERLVQQLVERNRQLIRTSIEEPTPTDKESRR